MATIARIGTGGTYLDTEQGFEPVASRGTEQEQAAAGGDTNVSATTQALVITEQAADVNLNVTVAGTTQALTITEQSADVNLNVTVDATTQALTITEQAATVSLGVNVDTNLATLNISEQTADVNLDKIVVASLAGLNITTFPATIPSFVSGGMVSSYKTDHLKRLRMQQIRQDDDEIIAIIGAFLNK